MDGKKDLERKKRPAALLTAVVCLLNAREVLSMAQKLLGMVGGRLRKKG